MIWYYRVTGKAIGKSENSRRIGEAFCQMIEGLLTIVIDNGFRKRDKSRTVIVYLPERRVRKVNCWVVSRYNDKRAKIDINGDLFWNCYMYLLSHFLYPLLVRCFLFDSKNVGYQYQISII